VCSYELPLILANPKINPKKINMLSASKEKSNALAESHKHLQAAQASPRA